MGFFDKTASHSFNDATTLVLDCTGRKVDDFCFTHAPLGKGPLLEALETGRPVLLKNLDKAEGVPAILPVIARFASEEFDKVDVYEPESGQKFSVDHAHAKGFRLSATVTDENRLPAALKCRLGRGLTIEAMK